jgi:hypothetical protein
MCTGSARKAANTGAKIFGDRLHCPSRFRCRARRLRPGKVPLMLNVLPGPALWRMEIMLSSFAIERYGFRHTSAGEIPPQQIRLGAGASRHSLPVARG